MNGRVQLHKDLRPPVPAKPGRIARRDYAYKRVAGVSAFLFTIPLNGGAGAPCESTTPP